MLKNCTHTTVRIVSMMRKEEVMMIPTLRWGPTLRRTLRRDSHAFIFCEGGRVLLEFLD